ncbi:MAG: TonB-dependent receptor [Gammaproteobacteria bacterium]|nr:TonB-dependent receptor [Gammaproteobacteria bacterium]
MFINKKNRKTKIALAIMSCTGMLSGGVIAQSDTDTSAASAVDSPGKTQLEELIVTATRRETSLQDVPYNISAIGGGQIEAQKIQDSAELLRSTPGVIAADRGVRNASTKNDIRVRGLNVDGAARGDLAASSAATAATYINDTPLFANILLRDLERVEVLRGPQGTLYGSGALGGAVRYITKKPVLGEFEGFVAADASGTDGSGGTNWSGDLVVNLPLGDRVALRAAVSHLDYAGIIDYENVYMLDANDAPAVPGDINSNDAVYQLVEDADAAEVDMIRLSALAEISDNTDVTLTFIDQSDKAGGRRATSEGFQTGFGGTYGEYSSGSVQLEPSAADIQMLSAEVNVDLGFATLTSSTSSYDVNGYGISENTGFYAQRNWLADLYYNSPRPLARAYRDFEDEAFIQEVRLVSNDDSKLNWIVGAYYQDQDKYIGQTSTLAGYRNWAEQALPFLTEGIGYDENDNDFIFNDNTNIKEKAIFGELGININERLNLTGGVRWFDNNVKSDAEVQLPFYDGLSSFAPTRSVAEIDEDDVLFKGNLSYYLSDDNMVYLTISEGYRRGGAASVPTTGNFAEDPAWVSYGSDSVMNYQVGIKGSTDTLRYTASAYYVDWTDPQINTATTNWGFFTVANGDSAETKGVEISVDGQLGDAINYQFGYAYVDAKLTSDFFAPSGGLIASQGNRLPGIPKHMVNVAVDYTMEISNGYEFVARLDGYAQSNTMNYINNDSQALGATHPSFSLWNSSFSISRDRYTFSLFVKNMFNEEAVSAEYSEGYMGTDPNQNYFGSGAKRVITLPRTIGVSMKVDF